MADNKPKRKCQTGKVRSVLVEDFDPPIKLYVRTTAGRLARLIEDMDALEDARQSMAYPLALNFLHESLTDWDGVQDENEQPRPFSQEAIDDLDQEDVMTFINALQDMGEAGSGNPKAATASAEDSEEQPAP